MQTRKLDTQEANVKWFAARDARMRNIANASLYTDKQKTRAERMKLALEMVYAAGRCIVTGKQIGRAHV